MTRYYVYAEGGMGDIVANYYERRDFRCLPAFKAAHPEAYVRLVVMGQNSAAPDLFKHHPCIDEVAYHPWLGDPASFKQKKTEGLVHFEGQDVDGVQYPEVHPEVYLSPVERRQVEEIQRAGRYVTWQPWAGQGHRNLNNLFDLERMIDLILARDYNLVVVGGTSPKIEWGMHHPDDHIPASREGHPRVYNLLPLSNIRLCAALVSQAPKHIGTDSWGAVCAALNRVPSLVMTSNNHWDGGCPSIIKNSGAWIIHFDIWNRGEADLEQVINQFLP